jgi:hypothetical protein
MSEADSSTQVAAGIGIAGRTEPSPAEIAAGLGPFEPPADFTLGPEFEPPAPRPIPSILKKGSYRRTSDRQTLTLLVFGALCALYSSTRIVEELSYYLLPLGYLEWIGYGLTALAIGKWLFHRIFRGKYAYLVEGIPVAARVLRTTPVLEKVQGYTHLRFETLLEYRDPATGKLAYLSTLTARINGAFLSLAKFSLALQPGDYLTAVGKPGQFEQTLVPYPVLGLHPEKEAILYEGRPWSGISTLGALTVTLLIMLSLALLLGVIYVVEFCLPTENFGPAGLAAGVGAAVGAAACLAGCWARYGKNPRKLTQLGLVGLLLGAGGGFMTAALVNASFDKSASQYREVQVVEFWQTTHHAIFRDYSIEYRVLPSGKRQKMSARIEKMQKFGLRFGAIEIGAGALGMPWIRDIHPLAVGLARGPAPDGKEDDAVIPGVESKTGGKVRIFFQTPSGRSLKPSPAVVTEVAKQLSALKR